MEMSQTGFVHLCAAIVSKITKTTASYNRFYFYWECKIRATRIDAFE